MRGDRPGATKKKWHVLKFTPHARGSTPVFFGYRDAGYVYPACAGIDHGEDLPSPKKVYPACAGIDRLLSGLSSELCCLPRMRGDRPEALIIMADNYLFTPHARGSTPGPSRDAKVTCVYPACAGIDPASKRSSSTTMSLPRMRGDRPRGLSLRTISQLFTPHARGSTYSSCPHTSNIFVYPACAGIDLWTL